ncbi:hypothetical protein AHF37_03101 [Paragonimus kellicotti]|nr:hypothetical protein AHF37_03101 [Paragonimus kellicotti]
MSQVNSGGATVSNSITPWNRTPGKPGIGTGNSGAFATNRWPNGSKSSNTCLEHRQNPVVEEQTEKMNNTASDAGQMWPSLFESPKLPDTNTSGFSANADTAGTTNQWSVPSFSGPIGSTSLLLTAPCATPTCSTGGAWSLHTTSSSSLTAPPRAITGQQIHHSTTSDSDSARRYLTGNGASTAWSLGPEPSELVASGVDDRTNLSIALSKMNMNNTVPSSGFFQPIQDFQDGSLLGTSTTLKDADSVPDLGVSAGQHQLRKKPSSDKMDGVDALYVADPDEAIRTVVNTTEPWGLNPVDQSTPWNISELANDSGNGSGPAAASPVNDTAGASASSRISGAHSTSLFDGPGSTASQSRRVVGNLSGGRTDLESNIWLSEPPNGTGIWESHYESLGERTARWQQNINSTLTQPGFVPHPSGVIPGFIDPINQSVTRPPQLPSSSDSSVVFRGFNRPAPNLFPTGGTGGGLGVRPVLGAPPHAVGSSGASRAFPVGNVSGLNGPNGPPWPFSSAPTLADGINSKGSGRWPNANFSRLTGKQQQQTLPHMLSSQSGNAVRWPTVNHPPHVPGGWPLTDPRRPNLVPGAWANSPTGETPNYFGSTHQLPPPSHRMCQQSPMTTDFPTPIITSLRGPNAGMANQAFRAPSSAFYPTQNSNFSSAGQRMFLSPQQHSQQLQQQSVLRANAMRQLVHLGFPDDEVQALFSDINTNVERALMDLRDRTCHPGLDEMIRSLTNSGLLQMNNLDDGSSLDSIGRATDQLSSSSGMRPVGMRAAQHPVIFDQSLPKLPGGMPVENLELSLHVLQQRETQTLQTIMQLQSKHQELNQKLNQFRTTNLPFATNPVMQELQLQAYQIASQLDAQHTRLRLVRSQAGMLKQITVSTATNLNTPPQPPLSVPINLMSNSSAFTLHTSAAWPSANPTVSVGSGGGGGGIGGGNLQPIQLPDNILGVTSDSGLDSGNAQEQSLKLGSGSFFWESGPWSGSGPRVSGDPYSTTGDRRWSSNFPTRPPYGALGDPRWTDLGAGDVTTSSGNSLLADSQRPSGDADLTGMGDNSGESLRSTNARCWLLAHNIPPHVSVGVWKMAISTALMKHAKAMGNDKLSDSQLDFELHPNMSARWVLIGLNSPSDASAVQECLESPGGEQNSVNYGSIKAIPPAEALLRLQDIQSLASRLKAPGNLDATSSLRSTNAMHSFDIANGVTNAGPSEASLNSSGAT